MPKSSKSPHEYFRHLTLWHNCNLNNQPFSTISQQCWLIGVKRNAHPENKNQQISNELITLKYLENNHMIMMNFQLVQT